LSLVPDFVRRGLKTPVHLAFSYDEEVGCVGVRGGANRHGGAEGESGEP